MIQFDINDIKKRKHHYKSLYWPIFPRFQMYGVKDYSVDDGESWPWFWKYSLLNWGYRFCESICDYIWYGVCRDYLFDKWNWTKGCSPGFIESLCRLWNNAQVFFTPWYSVRRKFMTTFACENDSKLLNHGSDYTYIRNREADCAYYTMTFTGFHYKLVKTVIRDKDGKATNGFITGICIAFSDKSDEEKKEEAASYKEESTIIKKGWVFTFKDAVRELNEIVKITPDLDWCNWDKELNEGSIDED